MITSDVKEVMQIFVVEDVRKRWPNPDGVPYCGQRRRKTNDLSH